MSIKPLAYRHRWFDSSPYTSTSWQWYPWEYCDENKYREILAYIEGGYKYEAEMLYAIPDTHRVVSVEDLKLLLSFAPGEIPKGLDHTFYFTLTQGRDPRIGGQLARIRAIIEDKP